MSYILEALRKSERERQLVQTPSLPVLVADAPPQRQRWLPWTVSILLLAMNVAVLFYFGFGGKDAQLAETQKVMTAPPAQPVKQAEPKVVVPNSGRHEPMPETPRDDRLAQQPASATRAVAASPSASNPQTASEHAVTGAAPSTRRSAPEKTAAEKPPAADRKPLPAAKQIASDKASNEAKTLLTEKAENPVARPEAIAIERPVDDPAIPALLRQAHNAAKAEAKREELPLLSAMPEDIRSRVPALTVNMLAFSSAAEERFAVVNMVKYTSGDQLPGGAVLLEIRSDGLVLDLDGTRFRIPQR